MAILTDIDISHPLSFRGIRNERTDDPEMIRFAKAMNTPQLQMVAQPATAVTALTADDGATLLAYLPLTPFFGAFQQNLQCLSETAAGEPLLTGWMPLERFGEFLAHRQAETPLAPLAALASLLDSWAGLHVHEVVFDGYGR